MTGLYVHNHGVLNNVEGAQLPVDKTIQHHLHEAITASPPWRKSKSAP